MPWQPDESDLQVSVRRFLDERAIPCKIHPQNRGRLQFDLRGIDPGQLRALYSSSSQYGQGLDRAGADNRGTGVRKDNSVVPTIPLKIQTVSCVGDFQETT